jgi:hypothetical protein
VRKLLGVALSTVAVLAMVPGPASAGKKGAHQHVEGSVAVPQGTQGAAGCVYRTQRALYIAFGDAINGIFGYTFQVDPRTANKKFKLEVSDGAGVDLQFYAELGSDPTADAPANVGFETPGPGGEKGTVPEGYPNAFVCLTDGANASFVYKAGAGVK